MTTVHIIIFTNRHIFFENLFCIHIKFELEILLHYVVHLM